MSMYKSDTKKIKECIKMYRGRKLCIRVHRILHERLGIKRSVIANILNKELGIKPVLNQSTGYKEYNF